MAASELVITRTTTPRRASSISASTPASPGTKYGDIRSSVRCDLRSQALSGSTMRRLAASTGSEASTLSGESDSTTTGAHSVSG